jgi:hypothetical protein
MRCLCAVDYRPDGAVSAWPFAWRAHSSQQMAVSERCQARHQDVRDGKRNRAPGGRHACHRRGRPAAQRCAPLLAFLLEASREPLCTEVRVVDSGPLRADDEFQPPADSPVPCRPPPARPRRAPLTVRRRAGARRPVSSSALNGQSIGRNAGHSRRRRRRERAR